MDPDNSQATATQEFVSADGAFVDNWPEQLGEEFAAESPTLSRFKNVADLSKSYVEMRKKFGHDPDSLIRIPKEGSPDDVKAAFWKAAGKPDTVDGYKYERSKDLSDNVDTNPDQLKAFAEIAHKHNLNAAQYNGVVNDYLAILDKDIANFDMIEQQKKQQQFEAATAELKKKWGRDYDRRAARANLMLQTYAGADAVAKLGLQNSPAMVEFLDNIAEVMSEDVLKGATSTPSATPAEIDNKIAELRRHPAYLNSEDPQHKQIVAQLSELYKKKSA